MEHSVWTIGHSTRSSEEFTRVLHAHRIDLVADVRRFPASRRLPHFSAPALESHLAKNGISYHWIAALGGRRRSTSTLTNSAWRATGFRAYADHVESDEFADGLFELLTTLQGLRTAVMCAELLWWRCHRRLIADVLTSVGIQVWHIRGQEASILHRIGPPARRIRGVLTYEER